MLARIDGRVYYNLGNWYRALALLPGFAINRAFMETMMGVSEPLAGRARPGHRAGARARVRGCGANGCASARSGCASPGEALRLRRTVEDFYRRLERCARRAGVDARRHAAHALAAEYRRIEADLLDRWDAPLINDFLCMMAFGASRKLLERWAGPAGLELHNDVMIGQGDIVSAEPAQRIRAMGQLLAARTGAARRTGAGRRRAGSTTIPELQAPIDELSRKVRRPLHRGAEAREHPARSRPGAALPRDCCGRGYGRRSRTSEPDRAAPATSSTLFAGRPVRRARGQAWCSAGPSARVRDRENLRFERTRIFGRARRLFRAVGRAVPCAGPDRRARRRVLPHRQEVLGAIEGFAVEPRPPRARAAAQGRDGGSPQHGPIRPSG